MPDLNVLRSVMIGLVIVSATLPSTAQKVVMPVAIAPDGANVDSMAFWLPRRAAESQLFITEKGAGLMVVSADASATLIRRLDGLQRPNAIVIEQSVPVGKVRRDLAFVTERDGDKVSVFTVPDLERIGEFAVGLKQPMGISLYRDRDKLFAFVVPKRGEGSAKVVKYALDIQPEGVTAEKLVEFGAELTPNQETVVVDRVARLVYVADETAKDIKIYGLDGKFERSVGDGHFQAQVEGFTIAVCGRQRYVIASDQLPVTEFEVFRLPGFDHVGTVITTARITDGVAVAQVPLPGFPNGIFAAQSDPVGGGGLRVELFDLKEFMAAAGVRCGR